MIIQHRNELKIFTAKNDKEKIFLAERAKENHLFVPKFGNWNDGLYSIYDNIITCENTRYIIKLGVIDDIYVAVSTLYKMNNRIEIFVKPKYRRKGIGTLMIESFGHYGERCAYKDATKHSNKFFDALKIKTTY